MPSRFPSHLRKPIAPSGRSAEVENILADLHLNTVCREARCPNRCECYGSGTATFLLLGGICTRRCRFCAISKGSPLPPDPDEPEKVALAADSMGLSYIVLTSVTRDDLADGGAAHFALTAAALKRRLPGVAFEFLIPDLQGRTASLEIVLQAGPDVLNHNVETVPRLYADVRPGADYHRSLRILTQASGFSRNIITKSGLMLGLGETFEEADSVMRDLRRSGCSILTLGQYLSPGGEHYPTSRYVEPAEFEEHRIHALAMGFQHVESGPFVRSSYKAREAWMACMNPQHSEQKEQS